MQAQKVISNKPYTLKEYLKKLYFQRGLFWVLTKREFAIKYANTFIGLGWFILQPIILMTTYTVFFGILVKINTDGIPYAPFVFSGLIFWNLFSNVITRGGFALNESSEIIHKTAIPRLLILISKTIPTAIENLVLLLLLYFFLLFTPYMHSVKPLLGLIFYCSTYLIALAIGIIISHFVVKFRDFTHLIPIAINFGIWLTPVFYSISILPENIRPLLKLFNPIAANIDSFRNILFNDMSLVPLNFLHLVIGFTLLALSIYFFIRKEKHIGEKI